MPLPTSQYCPELSLDTETSGLDLWHKAAPFLVTFGVDEGRAEWYEWQVDPLTREVAIPRSDFLEILVRLRAARLLILQNSKFDYHALRKAAKLLGLEAEFLVAWDWAKVRDTLIAGHLLGSNHGHSLDEMLLQNLGINIHPWEDRLREACKEARSMVQRVDWVRQHGKWWVAKEGDPGMPSIKGSADSVDDKPWKNDSWLLREVARVLSYDADHPWWTVTSDYANTDSVSTKMLWQWQEVQLRQRDLWDIYLERLKLLQPVAEMEEEGVPVNRGRLEERKSYFLGKSEERGAVCRNIAASFTQEVCRTCNKVRTRCDCEGLDWEPRPFQLVLPKNGVNNSLREFCFEVLGLEPIVNPKAKTTSPSLDAKNAIPHYLETLPEGSKALAFLKALAAPPDYDEPGKRAYDTALSFVKSYEKFWIPLDILNEKGEQLWYLLHPSLNLTGTITLRWSSKSPNSQQISKKENVGLRSIFGPLPDEEWWSCDAQNIQLRIPAYEAEEKELIDLFERADEPPYYGSEHLLNFSTVYPDIWSDAVAKVGIDKAGPWCKKTYASTWYQRIKNGDFAIGFGATDREDGQGTADKTFGRPGSQARLTTRFAKKEKLNQKWISFADRHGYVETLPDKTVNPRRGYPLLCSRTEWGKIKPTVPLVFHVQGSEGWWMGKAVVRCGNFFRQWNAGNLVTEMAVERERQALLKRGARLVMQIHDELVFAFPKGVKPEENLPVVRHLAKLMAQGGDDIGIPTPVSIEYHEHNFGEGVRYAV